MNFYQKQTMLEFVSPTQAIQIEEGCVFAGIELVRHEIFVDSNDVLGPLYAAVTEKCAPGIPVYAFVADSQRQFRIPYWLVRLFYALVFFGWPVPGKFIYRIVLLQNKVEVVE